MTQFALQYKKRKKKFLYSQVTQEKNNTQNIKNALPRRSKTFRYLNALFSLVVKKYSQACDWLHFLRVREHIQPCSSTGKNHPPFTSLGNSQKQTLKIITLPSNILIIFKYCPLGLKIKKQSGKFYAVKMAPVDWGSGVCASAYESYMKLSVSKGGTPMLLWTQLFC